MKVISDVKLTPALGQPNRFDVVVSLEKCSSSKEIFSGETFRGRTKPRVELIDMKENMANRIFMAK